MKKTNAKKIAAMLLALMMCAGAVGCGAQSEEEKLENKLNSITEEEFNSLAEEFEEKENSKATTTKPAETEKPAAEETPAETDVTPPSLLYYDWLAEEYDKNEGLHTAHTDFVSFSSSGDNYAGFYLHGNQIFYTCARKYDEAKDNDAITPLTDYYNTIAAQQSAEDADKAKAEKKSKTLNEYIQDALGANQRVVDLCSYDIETKTTNVITINVSNSVYNGSTEFSYAGGYFFVSEAHYPKASNFSKEEIYNTSVLMRISPDGTIDVFNDDTTNIDGVPNYTICNAQGDGSAILCSSINKVISNSVMKYALLDSDFKTIIPIPDPVKVNEHGTTTAVDWDGTGAVRYGNKLFIPALSIYYDLTASEWNTIETKFEEDSSPKTAFDVVGKYVISEFYMLDMESGEYIIDNVKIGATTHMVVTGHHYYGGNSLLHTSGGALASMKYPSDGSDPIKEEIMPDFSGTLLSNEYYYVSDEYGYFLHKIGVDGEDPIVTIGAL